MSQQIKRYKKKLNTWYNKEKENNLTHGTTKKREKYNTWHTKKIKIKHVPQKMEKN